MMKRRFALSLAVVAVALSLTAWAQAADFRVPNDWVMSPENDKAEGEAGYRVLHEQTGIEMVYVPGGAFMMGSADGTRMRAMTRSHNTSTP